jgi:hypothetical protein
VGDALRKLVNVSFVVVGVDVDALGAARIQRGASCHPQACARSYLPLKNRSDEMTAPASAMSQPTGYGRIRTPHHIECPLLPPIPQMALKPNHDIKNLAKTSSHCPARVKSFLVSPPSSCVVSVNVTWS